ncbi:MAG: hypothetical protein HGB05_13155 [Chloroflexi bacterium]|nr:hypothetical protein [Chloroflexota bacterium]
MPSLNKITDCIASAEGKNGELLALYVKKYFYDIDRHIATLCSSLKPGAEVHYIIGNSIFYGVHVPTAQLYEEALNGYGFGNIGTRIIRKRNCNKQLFEYCTSATFGTASTATQPFQAFNYSKEEEPPRRIQLQLLEQDAQYKTKRASLIKGNEQGALWVAKPD